MLSNQRFISACMLLGATGLLASAEPAKASILEFGGEGIVAFDVPSGWLVAPSTANYLNLSNPYSSGLPADAPYGLISYNGIHFYGGLTMDHTVPPPQTGSSVAAFLQESPRYPAAGQLFATLSPDSLVSPSASITDAFFQFHGTLQLFTGGFGNNYTLFVNHDDGFDLKLVPHSNNPDFSHPLLEFSNNSSFGTSPLCSSQSTAFDISCWEEIKFMIPSTGFYDFSLSYAEILSLPGRLDAFLVPEPASVGLLGIGLAALGLVLVNKSRPGSRAG